MIKLRQLTIYFVPLLLTIVSLVQKHNNISMRKAFFGLVMMVMMVSCANGNNKQQPKADAQKQEQTSTRQQDTRVEAPDFELNDINGKPLKLSSLRGKYVILDFWGSWCVWCIKGVPAMKDAYNKYAGKFEILGIDCGDSEEKWKQAVARYELPWLHVYNPKNSKVLEDYCIEGFPTKIIIDPEGCIVKAIVGEDPAFYTLLDSLFK